MYCFGITQGSTDWNARTFDPGLESGKWAMRFLITCIAMTPLNTYFGWSSAIKLRKPIGLWAFVFAIAHVRYYINEAKLSWLTYPMQTYVALGLSGFVILTALAITSNHLAMRRLKKNWKRLHRFVYLASMAVSFHAILATTASKKLAIRDPQSIAELKFALAALIILLAVRMPFVRNLSKQICMSWRSRRESDLPIKPMVVPEITPECSPRVYADDNCLTINEFAGKFQLEGDENLRGRLADSLAR